MRHETRTQIYLTLRTAGKAGMSRRSICKLYGHLHEKTVDQHLSNMLIDRYVHRPECPDGDEERGRYAPGPRVPPIDGLLLERALEMIADCPAGVSAAVMCDELGCSLAEMNAVLDAPARAGRIESVLIPSRHGGGAGWALPGLSAAREPTGVLSTVEMACEHEHVRLPVLDVVDIDRIHRVRDGARASHFSCEMQGRRLHITSGSMPMTLPADHTEQLLQYLVRHALTESEESQA